MSLFRQKVRLYIAFVFLVKSAYFKNSYFSAKSKAIAFVFTVKLAYFENSYFSAKSKAIAFVFSVEWADF